MKGRNSPSGESYRKAIVEETMEHTLGYTHCIKTGCGKLYTTINLDGETKQVFIRLGKGGTCAHAQMEALGKIMAIALRHGASIEELRIELQGITCHIPSPQAKSCADAVAIALQTPIKEKE